MLENIIEKYRVTKRIDNQEINKDSFLEDYSFAEKVYDLLESYGGSIFENGMFQIYTFEKAYKWTNLITESYFPELKYDLFCFAVTWQGNVIAINKENNSIYLFDPATCEYFAMEDTSLEDFLSNEFLENEDDIIYPKDFEDSMKYLDCKVLDPDFSFGFKISLFLGGEDSFENLEINDTEVMWELQIQIAEGLNEIPD